MHSTAEINAVVTKAKQQRADYIASKVQGGVLPVAFVTLVSLTLLLVDSKPTENQAELNPIVDVSAENG
jgi:hypothetical protein